MRKSKTLARLRSGEPVRICSLGHFIPAYIRIAASVGYDCIWLDAEHRNFSEREIQTLLAYFHHFDIDCMLRPPTLEKTRLYRYLEDGATGLMIPHVSTAEKARALVEAVKFPPLGDRGLDGVGFDAGFLPTSDDFVEQANEETFLVVQIETPQAIENVDAIAAVEGVDGLFLGPGDLGLRIRRTETTLSIEAAEERIAAAAERHGKAWGMPAASADHVHQLHQRGARLIAHGGDYFAVFEMLKRWGSELDAVFDANQ